MNLKKDLIEREINVYFLAIFREYKTEGSDSEQ